MKRISNRLPACRIALIFVGMALSGGVAAAGALGAHEHGRAELQAAVEGDRLELHFVSPAMNLLGFEYAPKDKAQRDAVAAVSQWFESALLVRVPDRDCQLAIVSVEQDLSGDHGEQAHEHQEHHDHWEETGSETHSEFAVTQTIVCDGALPGQQLEVTLFERFPGIEVLEVSWLTDSAQGGASLQAEVPYFQLSR